MTRTPLALLLAGLLVGCGGAADGDAPKTPYEALLRSYDAEVVPAWVRWKDAEWRTHTQVEAGDFTKAQQAVAARDKWRATVGDSKWSREIRDLLHGGEGAATTPPSPLEKAALDAVSRQARRYPSTEADLMAKVADKEGLLARFRRRVSPKLDGVDVHPDELARRYAATIDTAERKQLWRATLSPAGDLKPGFTELRDLRNELAVKGGWANFMDAQNDEYGMTAVQLADLMVEVETTLRSLYQDLHTWGRTELGVQYYVNPPDLVPAHWLPSPLGEDWSDLVVVEHLDVDPALQELGAKEMVRKTEDWYLSIGLPALPGTFWERSSLYPAAPGARIEKTLGAGTWDIDLQGDVRVLMNARPSSAWMSSAYREFAFAHAYEIRHDARLPAAIRQEPPRALLGALGVWADLAATRQDRLRTAGLLDAPADPDLVLLHEALTYVPFVQFGAGTAVPFEYELYAENLAPGQMNSRWWGLLARHQGILPPETRTERWADFLAVEAFVDAPGRYVDHVLSIVIAFQLHEALCNRLGVDPRTADLTGRTEVGDMFRQVAELAGTEDWRTAVQSVTGSPPSADAMKRYFEPLTPWLAARNGTRAPTLPSLK